MTFVHVDLDELPVEIREELALAIIKGSWCSNRQYEAADGWRYELIRNAYTDEEVAERNGITVAELKEEMQSG